MPFQGISGACHRHSWVSLFLIQRHQQKSSKAWCAMLENPGEHSKRANFDIVPACEKSLADFAFAQSAVLLDQLGCGRQFLTLSPSNWHSNEAFLLGQRRAQSLSMTNDRAERALALLQEYNMNLMRDESEQQFLLQLIEKH